MWQHISGAWVDLIGINDLPMHLKYVLYLHFI